MTSANAEAQIARSLIVVVDGKHFAHPWAERYNSNDGGLALFDTTEEEAGEVMVYRNWDYLYWGKSPDGLPERVEVHASAKSNASIAFPSSLPRVGGRRGILEGRR